METLPSPSPGPDAPTRHHEGFTPSSEKTRCPFCEAEIGVRAKKCRHCGEWVARPCESCATPLRLEWAARGVCAECQAKRSTAIAPQPPAPPPVPKSRGVATATAILLGGLGMHKFYLGDRLVGLFYLMFCWTLIPTLFGLVEGFRYAWMDEADFQAKYSK